MKKRAFTKNPAHDEALEKLRENNGVLAAHSLGSGKTLLSLRAADMLGGKSLFITPASLVHNVEKEKIKHKLNPDTDVMSYQKAVNDIEKLKKQNYNLVVFDEAHKLRNTDTAMYQKLKEISQTAKHRLLLSATPAFNSPENLATLVNLAAGKEILPEDKEQFEKEFKKTEIVKPKIWDRILNGVKPYEVEKTVIPNKYLDVLSKHIHQYNALDENEKDFPSLT